MDDKKDLDDLVKSRQARDSLEMAMASLEDPELEPELDEDLKALSEQLTQQMKEAQKHMEETGEIPKGEGE